MVQFLLLSHSQSTGAENVLLVPRTLGLLREVVGWCEGAVYLTSPGRPTDIGLQLGKACYPCSG